MWDGVVVMLPPLKKASYSIRSLCYVHYWKDTAMSAVVHSNCPHGEQVPLSTMICMSGEN